MQKLKIDQNGDGLFYVILKITCGYMILQGINPPP